jgi:hypothetical protein
MSAAILFSDTDGGPVDSEYRKQCKRKRDKEWVGQRTGNVVFAFQITLPAD